MDNKKILTLGGKEFEIKVNYRMSYRLTKYRNKLSNTKELLKADKAVVDEIRKITESGKEITGDVVFELSPEARVCLADMSQKDEEVFSMDEQIDIVKTLTGIEDDDEVMALFDAEVELNGYDSLVSQITTAVSMVFTNAKDGLEVVE